MIPDGNLLWTHNAVKGGHEGPSGASFCASWTDL